VGEVQYLIESDAEDVIRERTERQEAGVVEEKHKHRAAD
jgi:hypothetical protein